MNRRKYVVGKLALHLDRAFQERALHADRTVLGIVLLLAISIGDGCAYARREHDALMAQRAAADHDFATSDPDSVENFRPGSVQEPRVGSRASATHPANMPDLSATEREALADVIEDIQSLEGVAPEERVRLVQDLKATDPKLWPQMVQVYKSTLAYRRQIQNAVQQGRDGNPQIASQQIGGQPTIQTVSTGPQTWPQSPGAGAMPNPANPTGQNPAGQPNPPRDNAGVAPGTPGVATASYAAPVNAAGGNPTVMIDPATGQLVQVPAQPGAASQVVLASATAPTNPGMPNPGVPGAAQQLVQQPATFAQPIQLSPQGVQQQLDLAIATLSQLVAADPNSPDMVARQEQLRLLYLAAGKRDEALQPIASVAVEEQQFWTNQLFGLALYRDAQNRDPAQRASQAAPHLQTALAQLSELAQLAVHNLAFCTEVKSYGVYTPFPENNFDPGQEVLLYAEIENFKSQETPQGFHTALKSSYAVYDAEGRRVAEQEFPLTEEHCRNRRRDFFIRYFITLPTQQLYEGKHTLRLSIEDTLGQKVGQAEIPFQVKKKAS